VFDTQEQADAVRALTNGTYYRVREVQERDAKITQLSEKLARLESGQVAQSKWQQTPEYKAAVERYHQIRENVSPDAASQYWKGVESQFQAIADQEYESQISNYRAEADARAGDEFIQEASRLSLAWVPPAIRALPDYDNLFQRAVRGFDAEIGAGNYSHVQTGDVETLQQEFKRYFQSVLVRSTNAQAAMKAASAQQAVQQQTAAAKALAEQRRLERVQQDAVEAYKRSLAQTRAATPPHPLGQVGSGVSQPTHTTPPTPGISSDVSPQAARKQARQSAREAARQFFRQP
jgi:hypothetical protein